MSLAEDRILGHASNNLGDVVTEDLPDGVFGFHQFHGSRFLSGVFFQNELQKKAIRLLYYRGELEECQFPVTNSGFRMRSEKDFAVYKLSSFARSAAETGNASLSPSAQGEDVPFTDCGIALVAAAQQVFRPAQQIRVFHPLP
jgi:hypothetical protein